jgi:tetratricopeptide (TPR) repeat protein
MERTKNKILVLVVFALFPVLLATAQKKDLAYYQCAFFESYRLGNMDPWPGLIAEMEKVKPADLAWQIELVKAMYGLVGYQIGVGKKDLAKTYVEKADVYLDKLLDDHPKNAQLQSLSGAFYGYKISFAFYKAPFFGPKSLSHIDKAIQLDPFEPMGYIEKGNSLMYRPSAFGGDKKEALTEYRKALKLMDDRNKDQCSWQKMLLRAFILKALYETNQTAEANKFMSQMQKDYGSMNWIQQFVGAEYIDRK